MAPYNMEPNTATLATLDQTKPAMEGMGRTQGRGPKGALTWPLSPPNLHRQA